VTPWQFIVAGAVLVALLWTVLCIAKRRAPKAPGPSQVYMGALRDLLDGNVKDGAGKLRKTVSEDTDNVDAYIRLGDLLRRSGHGPKALQVHQSLLERRNLQREMYLRVKRSLFEDYKDMGDLVSATDALLELTSADQQNTQLRSELLAMYERRGMWQEAVEAKKRLINWNDDDGRRKIAAYEANVGTMLFKNGKEEEAVQHLKSALKAYRDCVPALLCLGDISYSNGDVREAMAQWKRVVEISPKYSFLTLEKIERALFDQGKYGETKELYERLLVRDEENVSVHVALARIYVKMGENERAAAQYQKALEIEPEHVGARVGLARLHAAMGRSEEALNELVSVVETAGRRVKQYSCNSCGYRSKGFQWVCPRCGETESFIA
jgi:lipopolysaccharide biosynthesis regulator YciM